jgi:hypothetical protein
MADHLNPDTSSGSINIMADNRAIVILAVVLGVHDRVR